MASSRRTATNENVSTYGTGKDYTVLDTWEAATDLDMVTTTTSYVLEVYKNTAGGALWSDVGTSLAGAAGDTNSSYFRIIRPAAGEGHSGIPLDDGTCAGFKDTADSPLFRIDESYSQIQDLVGQLVTNSTNNRNVFGASIGGVVATNQAFVGCLVLKSRNSGAGTNYGFAPSMGFTINCLAHDCDIGYTASRGDASYNGTCYNCTATNCDTGFSNNNNTFGSAVAKNCCSSSNTTDWSADWTKTTCTAESATPTYTDSGNDDFHLAIGDTVCRGNGTDLSGDGSYAFDDDIDEETRGAWDIGFDEYLATGWTGTFNGITNPAKILGIAVANIAKVNGI